MAAQLFWRLYFNPAVTVALGDVTRRWAAIDSKSDGYKRHLNGVTRYDEQLTRRSFLFGLRLNVIDRILIKLIVKFVDGSFDHGNKFVF